MRVNIIRVPTADATSYLQQYCRCRRRRYYVGHRAPGMPRKIWRPSLVPEDSPFRRRGREWGGREWRRVLVARGSGGDSLNAPIIPFLRRSKAPAGEAAGTGSGTEEGGGGRQGDRRGGVSGVNIIEARSRCSYCSEDGRNEVSLSFATRSRLKLQVGWKQIRRNLSLGERDWQSQYLKASRLLE